MLKPKIAERKRGGVGQVLDRVEQDILARVNQLVDPETRRTFGELNIILDVKMNEDGTAKVTFAPTSPFSPIAFNIGADIKTAASEVKGVKRVQVVCQGHMMDELVNRLVNTE